MGFRGGNDSTGFRADRLGRLALAAALVVCAQPLAAQSHKTDPELEALVPDAALDHPDAWVQQGQPPANPATTLDPNSPLADLPGIDLAWPDAGFQLPALASLPPDPDVEQSLAQIDSIAPAPRAQGVEEKISSRLALTFPAGPEAFPERAAFTKRFEALSVVKSLGNDEDSAAQLTARAKADRELLVRLLRIYGYYDGEVYQSVAGIVPTGDEAKTVSPKVRFAIIPGARYRVRAIALGDLAATGPDYPGLRKSYKVETGDPLNTDKLVEQRTALDVALGENGYAFAKTDDPDLLVDHRREEGDVNQPVTTGGKYRFAGITSNMGKFMPAWHLEEIARFKAGDLYKRSEAEDLRRAVLATGLVSSVLVKPREVTPPADGQPGTVAMDVTMTKAPLRTVTAAAGYGTDQGFRLEATWENRNLFPPEGMLRFRGVAGTQEQLAGVTFRRNNFKGRDQVLTLDAYATTVDNNAYKGKTAALTATFEKLTTLLFQKPWVWSVGLEAIATHERQAVAGGVVPPYQTYFVAALPVRGAYDGSDNLLDPTRGFRVALRVSPEESVTNGTHATYARIQADASYYQPFGSGFVLAARTRLGSIPGTAIENIAPSRRFYAGGGGSVRGYGYQKIGPTDTAGNPSGGRSLTEFSLEARVNTGMFGGALQVVPFVDAGEVDTSATPKFNDLRLGAGLGVRYKTGFGPIRVDVGVPLNRRKGDAPVGVYVALGQAF